ncbi:terpenoid synthase [Favolaschia claudopus]|uniref:Terpenoid synthase n=1 Tax=Favolaschia claudopus TaxID=2862362 RepID=A0AAV9ZQQ3_9AGAR
MSTRNYAECLQRYFDSIGYRYQPLPPPDPEYWERLHTWVIDVLGPTTSWSNKQLAALEHAAGIYIERGYGYASLDVRFLYARLTALCLFVDDSIENDTLFVDVAKFSHQMYRGQEQQHPALALYQATMQELSDIHGNNTVLRDLAVLPWIVHIDACMIEKQILTLEQGSGDPRDPCVSPKASQPSLLALAPKFPHYMRGKSGIAEAYAALIFKATKAQDLPLIRYVRALPDLLFFLEVNNDVLSFYKEELAGETYNLIHLRTQSLVSVGAKGTGINGQWTLQDTVRLLCDELRDSVLRIDGLFRLEQCERSMRGEWDEKDGVNDLDDVDLEIARQWRFARDGNIAFHLDCKRYKLDFLKEAVIYAN